METEDAEKPVKRRKKKEDTQSPEQSRRSTMVRDKSNNSFAMSMSPSGSTDMEDLLEEDSEEKKEKKQKKDRKSKHKDKDKDKETHKKVHKSKREKTEKDSTADTKQKKRKEKLAADADTVKATTEPEEQAANAADDNSSSSSLDSVERAVRASVVRERKRSIEEKEEIRSQQVLASFLSLLNSSLLLLG